MFYYTVKNLPAILNSCFAYVHLLALCYSHDLKVYGFDPILGKFVSEIEHLNSAGFCGDFPLIGSRTVYVTMLQVACDNLALNGMLGFIESFSADFFCTLCYATQSDIQSKYCVNEFELRTEQWLNMKKMKGLEVSWVLWQATLSRCEEIVSC